MDLFEMIFLTRSFAYLFSHAATPVRQNSIWSPHKAHSHPAVEKYGSATPLAKPPFLSRSNLHPSVYLDNYFIATNMKVVTVAFKF